MLSPLSLSAQVLPTSAGDWLNALLKAESKENPSLFNPIEKELSAYLDAWKKKLAILPQLRDQQAELMALSAELKGKDITMLEYLLMQETFTFLGVHDAYEPTMWLLDASKKAQKSSKDQTNPFNTLSLNSLTGENAILSSGVGLLNKAQSINKMGHVERVLRLLAALNKLPESQQENLLSLYFGAEKSKRILPLVKIGDKVIAQYDKFKHLQSMQQALGELVTISNLKSFYSASAYQSLLESGFGKNTVKALSLPSGDENMGMILAVMAGTLQHKSDVNKIQQSLTKVYLHPKVVPLLLEISHEMRGLMKIG